MAITATVGRAAVNHAFWFTIQLKKLTIRFVADRWCSDISLTRV